MKKTLLLFVTDSIITHFEGSSRQN